MSSRRIDRLPGADELERITRAIATLDAILCADWESRYFSFNRRWAPAERMASMRNGCGDEWFMVFADAGVFLKGFAHEAEIAGPITPAMLEGIPPGLAAYAAEPSFTPEYTSYVTWWQPGSGWRRSSSAAPVEEDPDGSEEFLDILDGNPATYLEYATEYFEPDQPLPIEAIAAIYAGEPLTAELLARLGSERDLEDLAEDLAEIGYPTAP